MAAHVGFFGTLGRHDDAVETVIDALATRDAAIQRKDCALVEARRVLAHEPGAVTPDQALAEIAAALAWDEAAEAARRQAAIDTAERYGAIAEDPESLHGARE